MRQETLVMQGGGRVQSFGERGLACHGERCTSRLREGQVTSQVEKDPSSKVASGSRECAGSSSESSLRPRNGDEDRDVLQDLAWFILKSDVVAVTTTLLSNRMRQRGMILGKRRNLW